MLVPFPKRVIDYKLTVAIATIASIAIHSHMVLVAVVTVSFPYNLVWRQLGGLGLCLE